MKNLNKQIAKKYAFVSSGVVYNISSESGASDACCVAFTSANTPSIKTKKGDEEEVTLYFDGYVIDGDEYGKLSGDTADTFYHKVHAAKAEDEETIRFQDWYKQLCEEQIADTIISKYNMPYSAFTPSNLGVPDYMFNGSGYTTIGIEQINFTESYYNGKKANEVKKKVYESAYNTADKYGYKLTSPSGATEIDIVIKA